MSILYDIHICIYTHLHNIIINTNFHFSQLLIITVFSIIIFHIIMQVGDMFE